MCGAQIGGVAAEDLGDAAKPQRLDIVAQQRACLGAVVDKQRERGAARDGLDAERAGTGKEIEHARALDRIAVGMNEDVEHRLAQAVRGRPDFARGRRGEIASLQSTANHAHALFVPRLKITLTVIAAPGSPRRTVAAGFKLVAGSRLVAARSLHQHATALAIGHERALAGGFESLPARRRFALGGPLLPGWREIRACARDHFFAKLLTQHACPDFLHRALGEFAELERTVGDPDQAVHLQPEVSQHVAHLTVLALADREHKPDIAALVALQRRIDRAIFDTLDLDTALQFVKLRLRDLAVGTHAVAPQPAGFRQLELARKPAI